MRTTEQREGPRLASLHLRDRHVVWGHFLGRGFPDTGLCPHSPQGQGPRAKLSGQVSHWAGKEPSPATTQDGGSGRDLTPVFSRPCSAVEPHTAILTTKRDKKDFKTHKTVANWVGHLF